MHKYRILSNGGAWRVQRRSFLFFWKTVREMRGDFGRGLLPRDFRTLTEAIDFIREYEATPPRWKVYEYFTPELPGPEVEEQT